jgi:hypothetical protein
MRPLGFETIRPAVGSRVRGTASLGTPFSGEIQRCYTGSKTLVVINGTITPISLIHTVEATEGAMNMQFKIPCETFARLSIAAVPLSDVPPTSVIDELACVYLEHRKGQTLAIATNNRICAIERLGNTDQPDGSVCVTIDPVLVQQCLTEAQFDGELTIDVTDNEILRWAAAKTSFGYTYNGNAGRFPEVGTKFKHWADWRSILPPARKKQEPSGFLHFRAAHLEILAKASPSGCIIFPEIINTDEPILLRDSVDPNWLGMFMGVVEDSDEKQYEPATRPEWLK